MPAIRNIAEVVLNTRDIGASEHFYTSVVGLRVHARIPDDQPTIVFLAVRELDSALGMAHPQVLALIDPARHAAAEGKFDPIDRRRSTLNHIAFEIEESDYQPELDRLAGLGVATQTVEFPAMRAKAIFFKDPDDNTVELICHDSSAPT